MPIAPSGPYLVSKTTVFAKFGSSSRGLATRNVPLAGLAFAGRAARAAKGTAATRASVKPTTIAATTPIRDDAGPEVSCLMFQ